MHEDPFCNTRNPLPTADNLSAFCHIHPLWGQRC